MSKEERGGRRNHTGSPVRRGGFLATKALAGVNDLFIHLLDGVALLPSKTKLLFVYLAADIFAKDGHCFSVQLPLCANEHPPFPSSG